MQAIKSTALHTPDGIRRGIMCFENGIIKKILPYDSTEINNVSNVGDWAVLPGIIDPHVHINEPGRTHWEGFNTASKAAAAGGVTTLVDMPLNSSPVTTSVEALKKKQLAADGKLRVNCGFWGGIVPGNQHQIKPLAEAGVRGFKCFLTHSGIDDFPNVSESDLRTAMPLIKETGLPLLAHCELSEETNYWADKNPRSYQDYLNSRPKSWENEAVEMMIRLCRETGCRVHIVHLSSAEVITTIENAKTEGLPLTVETGQHYLYFNAESVPDGQTAFKCAPPIREQANNELLWKALQTGIIDFVASDHSPAPPDFKEISSGDFSKAWGGIASLQFVLPVLWTGMSKRGISPEKLALWLSEHPAKLAGLADTKGRLSVGYEADFCIMDLEKEFTVTEDIILHRHKVCPYLGEKLLGVVQETWLKGRQIYQHKREQTGLTGEII